MTTKTFRDPAPEAPREPTTGIRPRAQLSGDEVAELVAVRGLLCELRPGARHDQQGPLSWSPMAPAPVHEEPRDGALAQRIRVQKSADPSPVPKDAFAGDAPVSPGVEMDAEIRAIAREGGAEVAAVLTWLQRNGTVYAGLPALCVALADALAPEVLRARWAAKADSIASERRRQWGLDAVLYAARWWRGERPVCAGAWWWSDDACCSAVGARASGTAGAAAGRCARPEQVRVRGKRCGSPATRAAVECAP